jgi:cytochrome b
MAAGAGECTQQRSDNVPVFGNIRVRRCGAAGCGYLSGSPHPNRRERDKTMEAPTRAVRVWDLPTRVFHWVLAVCVVASVVSAQIGGNAMAWHFRLGYVVFTLLAFRILWGLVGGHWSRFANFIYAPATVLRYLRGRSGEHEHHEVGHNPLGAFSVFGLLALLALQVGTGLFADDEIASSGPLVKFVSGATSLALTKWHSQFGQWLIIALVLLHVAAIVYYLLKKQRNLVRPMLTGDKPLPASVPASVDTPGSRALAAVLLGACAALVTWVVNLGA